MTYSTFQNIHIIMEAFDKMAQAPHFATAHKIAWNELPNETFDRELFKELRGILNEAGLYEESVTIAIDPDGLYHVFCLIEDSIPASYDIFDNVSDAKDFVREFVTLFKAKVEAKDYFKHALDINGNSYVI